MYIITVNYSISFARQEPEVRTWHAAQKLTTTTVLGLRPSLFRRFTQRSAQVQLNLSPRQKQSVTQASIPPQLTEVHRKTRAPTLALKSRTLPTRQHSPKTLPLCFPIPQNA